MINSTLDRIRSASVSRRDLSRWMRYAVTGATGAVLGMGLMGMLVQANRPDLNSFGGGYAYVEVRQGALVDIDPLSACQLYVDANMYLADGYASPTDFLEGCRAAVRKKH